MSIGAQLERYVDREVTQCFRRAVPLVHEMITSSPDVPRDTLNLQGGIRVTKTSALGSVKEARIEVTARSDFNGTDYPSILQKARRIEPRADNPTGFLHFMTSGGDWVRSRGFTNTHFEWWTRTLQVDSSPSIWLQALERVFN